MKLIHGTWIPQCDQQFIQTGFFSLWIETTEIQHKEKKETHAHPFALKDPKLAECLLELKVLNSQTKQQHFDKKYWTLPSHKGQAILSYELFPFVDDEIPETWELGTFFISCYSVLNKTRF